MIFNDLSIRIKIILGQILLTALVSAFIYTYYPRQQEKAAIEAIESEINSLSHVLSIGVGIGMGETDFVAVSEALAWANSDSAVVYISVLDANGQEIAAFSSMGDVPRRVSALVAGDRPEKIDNTIFYKTQITYQNMPFGLMTIGYSLQYMQQEIRALKITTLYFCLGLFTCGVLLSFVIGNMISGNITALTRAVKTISSGAEDIRVKVKGNDEIAKLARAFNNMLDRLDNSRQELVHYSEQLKKQNEELNQFSYVVSHDLKAPLRAIFKLSQWIEEDLGDAIPEDSKQNMKILRGRVFRLESLINGLLQYSKIGRENVPIERVNVQQLLKEILELLNPPPTTVITIQSQMPVFETKRILLQQVFMNLLSNAIKYNNKSKTIIDINVREEDDFYAFSVTDNGVGINPAYHKKVFEMFQTLNARDKVEATGVGLAIIKKSVEDMGGSITLESEENNGARFTFTWPKAHRHNSIEETEKVL